jgi:hypothetical protein
MYCGGGHLGFPIDIKNKKFVEDLPTNFRFSMPIGNPRWPPPQVID